MSYQLYVCYVAFICLDCWPKFRSFRRGWLHLNGSGADVAAGYGRESRHRFVANYSGSNCLYRIAQRSRKKVLETNILLWFALASIPAASIGAYMGVLLPEGMQTILLVIVMLFAAYKMFFPNTQPNAYQQNKVKLLVSGAAAGLVTGLVGVGGGFLMVPALIIYAGLNMQKAVANSLVLIAINASFAFITLQLSNQSMQLDWLVIAVMAIVASLSVLIGQKVASKLNQQLLKRAFALILLFVGVGLLIHLFLL